MYTHTVSKERTTEWDNFYLKYCIFSNKS